MLAKNGYSACEGAALLPAATGVMATFRIFQQYARLPETACQECPNGLFVFADGVSDVMPMARLRAG